MASKNQPEIQKYFRFDNAAHIYPAIRNQKQPGVFRASVTLNQPVNPLILQEALNAALQRLPGFSVKLRKGLFWNYFVHTDEVLPVEEDVINPCMQLKRKDHNGFLLRVRYHNRRIALEVFHAVADGSGALTFLKTLAAEYLRRIGVHIPPVDGILDCAEPAHTEESVDSFRPFASGAQRVKRQEPRAYQITGSALSPQEPIITQGTISIDALRRVTKPLGVSVTEYLTATLLFALYRHQVIKAPYRMLPIRVQVPVNLRAFFKTRTLRNFSSFVNVGLDPRLGHFTFLEILSQVHHSLRYEVNEKFLRSRVAANLRTENIPFLRVLPLFLKSPMINLGYKIAGPQTFSSILSNMGQIELPKEMEKNIERIDFILGASQDTKVKCAVAGYRGRLSINFTRSIKETFIERAFFTFFVQQGIPVEVESNQE